MNFVYFFRLEIDLSWKILGCLKGIQKQQLKPMQEYIQFHLRQRNNILCYLNAKKDFHKEEKKRVQKKEKRDLNPNML